MARISTPILTVLARVLVGATICIATIGPVLADAPRPAAASSAVSDRIRQAVAEHSKGKVAIDAVYSTPVPGIYEAVSGDDVFYVDPTGRYGLVDGRMLDLQTGTDFTALRVDKLARIDWGQLPLELAIKEVRGTGRRKVAVFEDPTCAACKVLAKFLSQLPDTTVYRFPYPNVDPNVSVAIVRSAWCAPNRAQAWTATMQGARLATAAPSCDVSGLVQITQVGESLRVRETPTLFTSDGRRLKGAMPPEEIIKALDESVQ